MKEWPRQDRRTDKNSLKKQIPISQLFDLSKEPRVDHNLATEQPGQVQKMVALLKSQIENGRSTPRPKLKNDKNVKMVNLADKRIPDFVKKLAK